MSDEESGYRLRMAAGFLETVEGVVTRVARSARTLGPQIHVESDYGDEAMRRTPGELFDRASAEQALALAEEAVALARGVVEAGAPPADGR